MSKSQYNNSNASLGANASFVGFVQPIYINQHKVV